MAYVKTVSFDKAHGHLKEAFDEYIEQRGFVPNVHAVSALRPEIMRSFSNHSRTVMGCESGVTPAEKEMIASVVSAVNKCVY